MPLLLLLACAPTDDHDADPEVADADTDADSDTDTDADALPDCGAYSGVGAPGRSWSFQMVNYVDTTWTFTETISSVDATTGAIGVSYAGAYAGTGYEATLTGTLSWLCDDTGLSLVESNIHWDSPSGPSDDVWEYSPPNLLIPYDPTVATTWEVAGTHNGIAFATTGSSASQGPGSVNATYGELSILSLSVTSGSRQLYRGVSTDMGLVFEQDATTAPYPSEDLTGFTP